MFLSWICLAILFLLIRFPALSIRGASQGLLLWYQVVVPTLAPFMLLTQLVQAAGGVRILTRPFYPLLHRLYGTSRTGAYILICGLLCGYPVGARLCADNLHKGLISPAEAKSLLCVCNHPSPMFLMGYVASQLGLAALSGAASRPGFFSSFGILLISIYGPVPLLYFLSSRYYGREMSKPCPDSRPIHGENPPMEDPREAASAFSFGELILSTSETLVIIGGTLMLFTILITWLEKVPWLSPRPKAMLAGFLEITTGIHAIGNIFPPQACLIPAVLTVTFGGCSGVIQTLGVIRPSAEPQAAFRYTCQKNAGLSIRHYVCWKALHAFLSALLLILLQGLLLPPPR